MEARKNPKTDAQRDQYLAVCRHTHDNIIFNYGSVENYIVAKNTEINTAESKLQSYYDNPRKGKSRRPAIIAGLENTIFIMKNSLTNALRDLEELDAARATETPQISTETAETVNVSAEGEKYEETQEIGREPEGREAACRLAPAWAVKKPLKYGYILYCFNLYPNGEFSISVENRNGCRILTKDEFRKLCSEPPQSPETPQTVECATEPHKLAQTA